MTTVITQAADQATYQRPGSAIAAASDRWIFVFMAVFFIVITLTGFIPDSFKLLAAVDSGERPPLPLVLHVHSVLMGSFLLLLLAQATLAANGRLQYHQRLGVAAVVLAPAIVVAGFILVPTLYHQTWDGLQMAPAEAQSGLQSLLRLIDNIMLLQLRIGILFSLFIMIALLARKRDPGLHKRMMFLAIAPALPAAFDRIAWLPNTLPESPLSPDLYVLLAVAPMFIWDLVRTRTVHKAYWIWLACMLPTSILIHILWDTDWWHALAPRLVGV
ncbi:MAG: hypothetical protein OEV69_08570 [Gammaproteobacteria bacterium]|nr:hypothetical protein [Gammaproteobacteria bacterium]MDH5321992.1 hypothetical protein [Gammaproteobacteria bacterium]